MSDKNLGQLIATLKSEAIEAAEKQAEIILANAKEQAEKIVIGAEKTRKQLLAEAEQEAQDIRSKGESALQQAGRDYSISVRNELLRIFQAVLEAETRKEFTPNLLKNSIVKVVENIGGEVELKLSPDDAKELADYIQYQLKSSEKAVTILADNSILNGFTITKKEEGWSYTISPEEVAEGLNKHLNKNWIDILKKESEK